MKVMEMEQALAAMSQQVEELQGVLKQNVALQVWLLRFHFSFDRHQGNV